VTPRFGVFGLTLFLMAAGSLRSRNDGLVAIGIEHLSSIVMNFHFAHSHGGVLIMLVPLPASRRTLIQPAYKSFRYGTIPKSG